MGLLESSKSVFMVGIKGVAMAGIARILTQMGKQVNGSDTQESQITDDMLDELQIAHSQLTDNLPVGVDLVVYSSAHGGIESVQVREAQTRGIKLVSQAALIAEIITLFPTSIAICGCHGKTGTSALLAYTLDQLGVKVSWLVGAPYFKGKQKDTGNIRTYPGGHFEREQTVFVFEADEYGVCPPADMTPKLLLYHPTHILCTNIDFDHPDVYKDIHHVRKVFYDFFTHAQNVYECNSKNIQENTLGVVELTRDLGFNPIEVKKVTRGFAGVARRMELHGERKGILCMDDYGHHPAEIEVTIREIRRRYPKRRLVVAFQSHTYSRTYALKSQFVDVLAQADIALVDAIFPSAREQGRVPVITADDLQKCAEEKGYTNVTAFANRHDLTLYAKTILKKGDLFLTLGAGDIYKIIPNLRL